VRLSLVLLVSGSGLNLLIRSLRTDGPRVHIVNELHGLSE
jgi:hypothetical protein